MKVGESHSVELTGTVFQAIKKRLANKESPAVVADVERILRDSSMKNFAVIAPLLFEMVNTEYRANVVKTTDLGAHFQSLGSLASEDGEMVGRVLTPKLVSNAAVMPLRGVNADEASVKGRITDVVNRTTPPPCYTKYAHEFVSKLVPVGGKGVPLSPADVRARQNKPMQVARFEKVKHNLSIISPSILKSFIKPEAYAVPNDPRTITTTSPELTNLMSCYTLPFKDEILKKQMWYGPGKTPKETVQRLREICRHSERTIATDYSRFDGTKSQWITENVTLAAYMRWTCPERRAELRHWYEQLYVRKAVTATGLRYDPGFATRSGGPWTTDGNTPEAAFVQYCANRNMGMSNDEAYAHRISLWR